ncbi:MAG: endolytic transglycosylase MltG [Pseudoflavonifractor sp.]|nr:endolytic transglycosylase MltG [Pseudoflavonifractor sp.]
MNISFLRQHAAVFVIATLALTAIVVGALLYLFSRHDGEAAWFYLPRNASAEAVADSIRSALGESEGSRVVTLWKLQGGDPAKAHGAYRVEPGQSALATSRRIAQGRQTPVKLTFNNLRTLDQLASRIGTRMECGPEAFMEATDSVLAEHGYDAPEYVAAFLPDTYEMYWTSEPADIVERLLSYRDAFWTDERQAKADDLGLTPVEVATIASIVEEESNKTDEYPKIARLYLNRLNKGMRLQADPTVKFAVGDFSLRRVRGKHLSTPSPYNTYLNAGLPPGPIRIPDSRAIDAVLEAPEAPYMYMCARPDFSGYHDFAADYQTHRRNARLYQAALNKRAIH